MSELTSDTRRKIAIIAAIATSQPSLEEISKTTGIPMSSLKRHISQLRNDLDMDIRFVPDVHGKGRTGHYHIFNWGVLHPTEFLLRYQVLLAR